MGRARRIREELGGKFSIATQQDYNEKVTNTFIDTVDKMFVLKVFKNSHKHLKKTI